MNFVISLSTALERRKHIEKEFSQNNVLFNFFDAVNEDTLNENERKYDIDFSKSNLSNGEKACFLSHVNLWEYLVNSDLKYLTIFEDDVYLSKYCNKYLNNYNWIPNKIHFIKIEKFQDVALMNFQRISLDKNLSLRRLKGKHLGTAGYIISKSMAKQLLNQVCSKEILRPIDQLIFNSYIKNGLITIYQLNPCLVIQADRIGINNLPSQLQNKRSKKTLKLLKYKKNIFEKIIDELVRIMNKIQKKYSKIYYIK
jgi:glycosyl transferase family 25